MNARDYNAVAHILAAARAAAVIEAERNVVRGLTLALADYFAEHNSRFDRERFYTAVGIR